MPEEPPLTARQITLRDTIAVVSISAVLIGCITSIMTRIAVLETRVEQNTMVLIKLSTKP